MAGTKIPNSFINIIISSYKSKIQLCHTGKTATPSERGGAGGLATTLAPAAAACRISVGRYVDGGGGGACGAEEADQRAPDRVRVGRHPDPAQTSKP